MVVDSAPELKKYGLNLPKMYTWYFTIKNVFLQQQDVCSRSTPQMIDHSGASDMAAPIPPAASSDN